MIRSFERIEREEGLVAQAGQGPSLRDENADLDLRLVLGLLARWDDDGAIMLKYDNARTWLAMKSGSVCVIERVG